MDATESINITSPVLLTHRYAQQSDIEPREFAWPEHACARRHESIEVHNYRSHPQIIAAVAV